MSTQQSTQTFWLVWGGDVCKPPKKRYSTKEAATEDAHLLCVKEGRPFYVMEAVTVVAAGEPVAHAMKVAAIPAVPPPAVADCDFDEDPLQPAHACPSSVAVS